MTEFKISIGMSTNTIKSNIDKLPHVSDKTKKLILNFCKNDLDHKVSNDIELAMLNSWANGSSKVPMPQKPSEISKSSYNIQEKHNTKSIKTYSYLTAKDASPDYFSYINYGDSAETHIESYNRKFNDLLIDKDGDGYADERHYYNGGDPRYSGADYYIDKNLNGNMELTDKNDIYYKYKY
ncbi:MAG: hypothetical protein ACI37Q_02790 [Candidatus Gastranaerophilaceae bacterium]